VSKFDEDVMQIVTRARRDGLPLGYMAVLYGRPRPLFPEFNLKDVAVVLDIEGDVGARLRRFAPSLGVTLAPPKLPDITIDSIAAALTEPAQPPRVRYSIDEEWIGAMLQVLAARRPAGLLDGLVAL
jgi:hypothetical protein